MDLLELRLKIILDPHFVLLFYWNHLIILISTFVLKEILWALFQVLVLLQWMKHNLLVMIILKSPLINAAEPYDVHAPAAQLHKI